MTDMYDVLIVGAGPAGLTAARCMAAEGWRVGVLEEHVQVGSPVNCSGIIGVEAFERFDLPQGLVRHTLQHLEFVSPRSLRWQFEAARPLARVVERGEFDGMLGDRARAAGAEILLGHRVTEVLSNVSSVDVRVTTEESRIRLSCRALIVATGAGMPLLKKLDLNQIPRRLLGVQTEVVLPTQQVEVYLGREWAPEGFAWVVPLDDRRSKVGLLCRRNAPMTLRHFLARPDVAERLSGPVGPIQCSMLPLGFLPKSYGDRVMVVGEAAGHIKATTCGGIYYGMLTAEVASEVLDQSLREDRLDAIKLSAYEKRWRALLEDEIETGLKLRRSIELMSDWGIERLMSLARRDGIARLIQDKANFDWHRDLIHAIFRHATVGSILGGA